MGRLDWHTSPMPFTNGLYGGLKSGLVRCKLSSLDPDHEALSCLTLLQRNRSDSEESSLKLKLRCLEGYKAKKGLR